jgi:dTDP-4-amino-4,6-dideoxygalactose transaminase
MYTVKVRDVDRDEFLLALRQRGVQASAHFDPPVHRQPCYQETSLSTGYDLPITDQIARSIVTLPIYPAMTERQCDYVFNCIDEALSRLAR